MGWVYHSKIGWLWLFSKSDMTNNLKCRDLVSFTTAPKMVITVAVPMKVQNFCLKLIATSISITPDKLTTRVVATEAIVGQC